MCSVGLGGAWDRLLYIYMTIEVLYIPLVLVLVLAKVKGFKHGIHQKLIRN